MVDVSILQDIKAQEWVLLALGIAIPSFFTFLWKIILLIRPDSTISMLVGDWYAYHYTRRDGGAIFRREEWQIKRKLVGLILKTTNVDPGQKDLQYRAMLSSEAGYVILSCRGLKHEEVWQIRLKKPFPGSPMMWGLYIGPDFDRESYASIMIVSSKRMSEADAKQVIHKRAVWVVAEASLRLGNGGARTDPGHASQDR